jgi:formate-dependent nitrite reductase membrane component NrfD
VSDAGPEGGGGTGAGTSYHGQPVLKKPVWGWEIPCYLFTGGLAGSSAGVAYLAGVRGSDTLAERAWLTASAAIALSPPLLISDLGRPERFFNMLRLLKVTSPMSVGSWILAVSATSTSLAALHALTGRFGRAAAVARPAAAVSGLGVSTYTAALLSNTAVPVWHEARGTLPFVFGAGAAVSAGGACVAATPVDSAAGARRLALGAAAAELAATTVMERRLQRHGQVYKAGKASRYSWLSRACLVAGGGLLGWRGARSRPAAIAAGALLAAGALATRWSVFEAGTQSAADPRYVVEPQRRRLDDKPVVRP